MRIQFIGFFLLLGLSLQAQKKLSGRIITADGGKPVASASVFLSNTSIGSVTNENGEFILERVPAGKFNLVVVSLGFETYTQSIESANLPASLLIELKPKSQELQEVTVGGYDRRGWEKWGSIFIENFIGTSAFATHCDLKNPQVLKFHYSEKRKELHVFSDEKLTLENRSLGYTVYFKLEDFRLNFEANSVVYLGYPLFSEMQSTQPALLKHWEANRAEAYYGSMMHFIRSLHTGNLSGEGFEVRRIKKITEAEQQRVKPLYAAAAARAQKITGPYSGELKDSLYYYKQVLRGDVDSDVLFDSLLRQQNLIRRVDGESDAFYFPDFLEVRYINKQEPKEYMKYQPPRSVITGMQLSKLFLRSDEAVVIYSNGSYYNPQDLYTLQFWAWSEKMAMMLPLDYMPANKK